jgi:hypothetical protein
MRTDTPVRRLRRVLAAGCIALMACLTLSAPVMAGQPGPPKAGATRGTVFDLNGDQSFDDTTVLSSLLASGKVVSDAMHLPAEFAGGMAIDLGTGHGEWRYDAPNKTLRVRTLHTAPTLEGGTSLWVVTVVSHRVDGRRFEGAVLFARYASLSDFLSGGIPMQELKAGATEVLMESVT